MRKRTFNLMIVFVLVLSMAAIMLPVSAQEGDRTECEETAPEGSTIRFDMFGDLSGPYAPITQPLIAGLTDAINYYNQAGGICGAEIVLNSDDTGNDQEVTQAIYDRFSTLDPAPLAIMLFASADGELLRDQLAADEIPVILVAGSTASLYGENADEPGWNFGIIPLYTDQFGAFCDWLAASWDDLGIEGDPAIGHLSWEGPFGRASESAETTAYCASVGVEVVGGEYFLPTATDVTAQIQNLVDAGANVIFNTALASGTALVAADLANLGLIGGPDGDQVLYASVNWGMDTSSTGLLGQRVFGADGMPSTDGMYALLPYTWWDEVDHPGIQIVQSEFDNNERVPTARGVAYLLSWAVADMYVEAVTQTINRVGFDNLSGAAMEETLTQLDYAALEGVLNFNWTEGRRAQSTTRIGMMTYLLDEDGNPVVIEVGGNPLMVPIIVPVTDEAAQTPDLRPGGADVPDM